MGIAGKIEELEPRRFLNGGAIDSSFGDNGIVTMSKGVAIFNVFALGNGQLLAAGNQSGGGPYVRRLFADGSVDPSFTAHGLIGALRRHLAEADAYALDSHGGLLVGGMDADHHGQVLRVTQNGAIDPSFGINGVEGVPLEKLEALTLLADGRIIVSGISSTSGDEDSSSEYHGFFMLRSNGRNDATFHDGHLTIVGIASSQSGPNYTSSSVVVRDQYLGLSDGRVLYISEGGNSFQSFGPNNEDDGGSETENVGAAAYTPDGQIDTTFRFDHGGAIEADSVNSELWPAVRALPDGEFQAIVSQSAREGDTTSPSYVVYRIRVNRKGTLERTAISDQAFSTTGAWEDDGSLLLSGGGSIQRLLPDGTLDGAFQTDPTLVATGATVAALQPTPDGNLIAAYEHLSKDNTWSTFLVKLHRNDAPSGLFAGHDIHAARSTGYSFTVNWQDDEGVDVSSLGNNDLYAILPDGTHRSVKLVATSSASNAKQITATYRVTAPDGNWDAGDNGIYQIAIRRGAVSDIHGKFAGGRVIGRFKVNIQLAPESVSIPTAVNPFTESVDARSLLELAGIE